MASGDRLTVMPNLFGLNAKSQKEKPQFQRKTAFKVFNATGQNIPGGVSTLVDFTGALYDLGANFNLTTNQFVVPYQGIYHYNATFLVLSAALDASLEVSMGLFTQFGQQIFGQGETWQNSLVTDLHTLQMSGSHLFAKDDQCEIRIAADGNIVLPGSATGALFFWSMYRVESESRTILGG